MKHFALLLVLALAAYFGWRYAPFRVKFFIKQFILSHLPGVALVLGTVIGLLFLQAGVTTKLF